MKFGLVLAVLLAGAAPAIAPAMAQENAASVARAAARPAAASAPRAMPAEAVTPHTVDLPGRVLKFTASVGAFRLGASDAPSADDAPLADLVTTAYVLDGAAPASRPVTFVFNGGPGASSAWLQFGALGPWRVAMSGAAAAPSAAQMAAPNAETWLDFTDLVFVDPAGAGFSRLLRNTEEGRGKIWSVEGDIDSLTEVMRRWLERAHRMASPKYIVGESYGGFRGPRLVRRMQTREGIGIAGLILVSPLLDYGGRSAALDPLTWATRLPSIAASAREHAGEAVTRETQAEVERYASGEFIADYLRGERDIEALDRMSARVARFTGLDPVAVRAHGGRVEWGMALRRDPGRIGAVYDSTVTEPDPFPLQSFSNAPDPIADGLRAAMTTAALELYGNRLNWLPEGRYEVLNAEVLRQWDFGRTNTRPESLTWLRSALALDPALKLLVLHGFNDLATPYLMTQMDLDQIPANVAADRVRFTVLPGGHMFYSRDESRRAFRDEAMRVYRR